MGLRTDAQRQRFQRLRSFDHDADPTAWSQGRLAGVDEAGVGPLAGPVVAAAVILPTDFECAELYDSKRLSAAARQRCESAIRAHAIAFAVARVSPARIDRINIARAMRHAQGQAIAALSLQPWTILVDGNREPFLPAGSGARLRTVVRGDSASLSVAAASILAKCARDRVMLRLDRQYPLYGFAQHKGYATESHLQALRQHGMCPAHRRSFCGFLASEAARALQGTFTWDVVPAGSGTERPPRATRL